MANDPTRSNFVGNLTADPELRHVTSGIPVANFTVAVTPRVWDREKNEHVDGETLFVRCEAWRDLAENVAATLTKGTRVFVEGSLKPNEWESEGEGGATVKNRGIKLVVDECGPSLRFATAKVARVGRSASQEGPQSGGTKTAAPAAEPASAPAAAVEDDEF